MLNRGQRVALEQDVASVGVPSDPLLEHSFCCSDSPLCFCNIDQSIQYYNIYLFIYLLIALSGLEADQRVREGKLVQTGPASPIRRGQPATTPQ
jgi:hypothetical protein